MFPQRWIEGYLAWLLRWRGTVVALITLMTLGFAWQVSQIRLHTDFFDFYPQQHPYIRFYKEFRKMFGSANIMTVILEVKNGDIYNPTTLQKLDRITKYMVDTKGVVPYQILSIAHPKVRSITASQGAIQIREIFYPAVPKTQEDADRVRFAVYANPGVRGVFVAADDTAAVVHSGFWEEALDFRELHSRMTALVAQEQDDNHVLYITGFPWLYTSVLQYANDLYWVFALTIGAVSFLLYSYFRTWTGIWVPIFSAVISAFWGLGIAALLGFNLDPLVLVVPIFLSARALSHSIQSMDRYHEEYYRLRDKDKAIIVSYSSLFAPAIAAIVTDGIGLLVVAVAPIPLIQKVAIFSSFWIISIFISVVTLHPIILKFIDPPPETHPHAKQHSISFGVASAITAVACLFAAALTYTRTVPGLWAFLGITPVLAWYWLGYCEIVYQWMTDMTIAFTDGTRKWWGVVVTLALFVLFPIWGWTLKVGDMSPGAALLFSDHPYNIAHNVLNEKFLGASQLIVVADTKMPDGIKGADALNAIEEFADHMENADGAGGTITVVEIVKQLARLYHDGDPKWGIVPVNPKHIGELFYVFTSAAAAGDLDRFMDPSGRYGSIITLFHKYSHDIIMDSIAWGKQFSDAYKEGSIEFRYAGGLFGILAAVNEAVEDSYWLNLGAIFFVIYLCLYLTYGSWSASAMLMIPVVLSQLATEAIMVWLSIDMNVNSLPIAAAGAGAGVDYGIYHFSRMIDTYDEIGDLDQAVDHATATTGKAIIFTASTMVVATIFWWISNLKFQAEMGLLLVVLMIFNTMGGLVLVPSFVKVMRPKFLIGRTPRPRAQPGGPVALAS